MTPRLMTFEEKYAKYTELQPNGCIYWTGYRAGNGYGRTRVNGRAIQAHRWSYEHQVGPIPDGLWIDHLCRNHACVNPDHLEPVTPAENTRRGIGPQVAKDRSQARTHCIRGHELTEENTYRGGNKRACRTCRREIGRAHHAANPEIATERSRRWRAANPERAQEIARQSTLRRQAKIKNEAV